MTKYTEVVTKESLSECLIAALFAYHQDTVAPMQKQIEELTTAVQAQHKMILYLSTQGATNGK